MNLPSHQYVDLGYLDFDEMTVKLHTVAFEPKWVQWQGMTIVCKPVDSLTMLREAIVYFADNHIDGVCSVDRMFELQQGEPPKEVKAVRKRAPLPPPRVVRKRKRSIDLQPEDEVVLVEPEPPDLPSFSYFSKENRLISRTVVEVFSCKPGVGKNPDGFMLGEVGVEHLKDLACSALGAARPHFFHLNGMLELLDLRDDFGELRVLVEFSGDFCHKPHLDDAYDQISYQLDQYFKGIWQEQFLYLESREEYKEQQRKLSLRSASAPKPARRKIDLTLPLD
jgi:hypothetical protein